MKEKTILRFIRVAAVIVFLICLYAFLLGNKVFHREFENDAISWYILAKGIFCSVSLWLFAAIWEALKQRKK